jgi:biotin transporter BioY
MLLVSPALVIAIWAGLRDRTAQLLWIATALVALPVFLYYGGGYSQYGFRYSLDFTPFLVALMAEGSRRWIGRPEKLLVVASVVSVVYGLMWGLSWHAG